MIHSLHFSDILKKLLIIKCVVLCHFCCLKFLLWILFVLIVWDYYLKLQTLCLITLTGFLMQRWHFKPFLFLTDPGTVPYIAGKQYRCCLTGNASAWVLHHHPPCPISAPFLKSEIYRYFYENWTSSNSGYEYWSGATLDIHIFLTPLTSEIKSILGCNELKLRQPSSLDSQIKQKPH